MKSCIAFTGSSDLKILLTLSPNASDFKKQFILRCISSEMIGTLKTIAEFFKIRIFVFTEQISHSNYLTWNENILFGSNAEVISIMIAFLPKEKLVQFQNFPPIKKNVGENSIINIWRPFLKNVIISESIHNKLISPGSVVSLQALCHSMFRLHLNSNDSWMSPVGIGKPVRIKRSVPGGMGKGVVAESIGLMFVVLGWSGDAAAKSIEIFNGSTQKWSFYQKDAPFMRAYHGVAVLGSQLYVVGGFNGQAPLPTMICLDVRSRQWNRKSMMSTPRCYVLTVVHHGEIYAIGGHNGERRLKTCEKFDPKRNKWSRICDMMYRRSDAGGAELNGKILVSGGFDGFHFHPSAEIYDVTTNQWTLVGRLLHPRSGHCMVNFDGQVLALGGFDGYERLREVEKFDEETEEWELFIPMLEGRSNFCTAVFQDEIYAIGGYDGNKTVENVEKFDKTTMEWQRAPSLNLHRSAAGACVISNAGNVPACELTEFVPLVPANTEESSP